MTLAQDLSGDLPEFFNLDEFAVPAVYDGYVVSAGGRTAVSKTVNVIFDNSIQVVNPVTAGVELTAPQAMIQAADVPNVQRGDTLTINAVVYQIIGIQPDGTGLLTLILSEDKDQ